MLFIPGNAGTYKQVRSFGAEMHKIIGGDYSKFVDVNTVCYLFYLNYFILFLILFFFVFLLLLLFFFCFMLLSYSLF